MASQVDSRIATASSTASGSRPSKYHEGLGLRLEKAKETNVQRSCTVEGGLRQFLVIP